MKRESHTPNGPSLSDLTEITKRLNNPELTEIVGHLAGRKDSSTDAQIDHQHPDLGHLPDDHID